MLWTVKEILANKRKLFGPFLWTGFNCLIVTVPLQGDSFLFSTSPWVSCTHLIDHGRIKCWVDLKSTKWFWTLQTNQHKKVILCQFLMPVKSFYLLRTNYDFLKKFNLVSKILDLKQLTITTDTIKQQHLEFIIKTNHFTWSAFPAT